MKLLADIKRRIPFKITPLLLLMIFVSSGNVDGATYRVGPGMKHERISDVPLDALMPGDIVKIHYSNKPYREKIILRRSGTKDQPIVFQGVMYRGKRPIIDGDNAIQFQKENWPQPGRWLIKVGDGTPASHIRIENIHIRNANNSRLFIQQKTSLPYESNASGVFVRYGNGVVIHNCIIHACGNGVQTSYGPDVRYVTLSSCQIYDNGNHLNLSSGLQHNIYLCGMNSVVQFCRFGAPHSNGNNIKDRGLDTVIRYNWIEGGKNRQLDLVDYKGYRKADAYVYGNVILQGAVVNNNNMIHWGGDSGHSRSGTLYLFNNTILAKNKSTRFLVTQYPDCSIEIKNNIFVGSGRIWNGTGRLVGSNNWFSSLINGVSALLGQRGTIPGFCKVGEIPYMPCPKSSIINAGTGNIPKHPEFMPRRFNGGGFQRPVNNALDIGAYELPVKKQ